LFENLLVKLNETEETELTFDSVLKKIGLPRSNHNNINDYLKETKSLCSAVREKLAERYSIENLVSNAKKIPKINSLPNLEEVLRDFHYSIITSKHIDGNILLLSKALSGKECWEYFTIEVIETLFGISEERKKKDLSRLTKFNIENVTSLNSAIISNIKNDKIVCFQGCNIKFEIKVTSEIPFDQFRIKVVEDEYIDLNNDYAASFEIDSLNQKHTLFELEQLDEGQVWIKTGLKKKISFSYCSGSKSTLVIVQDSKDLLKVLFPFEGLKEYEEEDVQTIEVNEYALIKILEFNNSNENWYWIDDAIDNFDDDFLTTPGLRVIKKEKFELGALMYVGFFPTADFIGNEMIFTCLSSSKAIWFNFFTDTKEKGFYTIQEEFRHKVALNNKVAVKRLIDCFEKEREGYSGLKGRNSKTENRAFLCNISEAEDGFFPILLNYRERFDETKEETFSSLLKFGDWKQPSNITGVINNDYVKKTIECYKNARSKLIQLVREGHPYSQDSSKKRRPLCSSSFVWKKINVREMETAISEYLGIYLSMLEFSGFDSLSYYEKFYLRYVDNYILCNYSDDGYETITEGQLLGPWHPLVIAKKFILEHNYYLVGTKLLANEYKNDLNKLINLLSNLDFVKWYPLIKGVGYISSSGY